FDGRRGRVARPLLDVSRAELRAYCRAHRLRWREDPTNTLSATPRNRIRLHLLPALERARPGAGARLVHLARLARTVEDAWRAVLRDVRQQVVLERARGRIVLAREALLGYDPQVRSRVLRRELQRLGRVPGRSGTRAVDEFIRSGTSGKGIALGGGVRIERERDRIVLRRVSVPTPDRPLRIAAPEAGTGSACIGGRRFTVEWAPGRGSDEADTFDVDPSALAFPLELRAWRPGDRIRLAYGAKKLKKLFLERGLGRARRAATPVLADAAGRVLWVPGIARAHALGPVEGAPGFHITVVDD
ncbi:MAG: tRNA lysidine(34) synthetase TilS, partial [Longimicrobiales bacterium]